MLTITFYIGLHTPNGPNGTNAVRRRAWKAREILTDAYDGLTILRGTGYWKGSPECTMVASTIVGDLSITRDFARRVAATIASALEQECVGVAFTPTDFELVEKKGS